MLYRAPIWLYRAGLGFLMGDRFLLLNHVGRKSGKPRQAVLEVANYLPERDSYLVACGFGLNSDWYLNVKAQPQVTIQVGRRRIAAQATLLSAEESGAQMADYYRRHPNAARNLSRLLGYAVADSQEAFRRLGEERIPFVAFMPRQALATTSDNGR
jgi:deazaflavin-dependent oxidoreductase (nitroreductase family)